MTSQDNDISVEVLVACMNQECSCLYDKMHLQTNAVFANQHDKYSYEEMEINGSKVKIITTAQRGVGKNRNMALLYAESAICIFADEDVIYNEGYEKEIQKAFLQIPKADVIIFNCHSDSERKPRIKRTIRRIRPWNFMGYGTCRIAFRRTSILKKGIFFSLLFGGGTMYSAGEDSLFLKEALGKGLKIYTHPYCIGVVTQETSTWFSGYNEKLFFDKGAWLEAAFPKIKHLLMLYFAFRFRKLSALSISAMIGNMLNGAKAYQKNLSYDEWNMDE
jgi:glycosyltransferase involved in cell wall biosynthesis